jgi:hypothetical protein
MSECSHRASQLTDDGWVCMDCRKLVHRYNPYTRPKDWFDIPSVIRVEAIDGRS